MFARYVFTIYHHNLWHGVALPQGLGESSRVSVVVPLRP